MYKNLERKKMNIIPSALEEKSYSPFTHWFNQILIIILWPFEAEVT